MIGAHRKILTTVDDTGCVSMRLRSLWISVITVIGISSAVSHWASEDSMSATGMMDNTSTRFSFGDPTSFQFGTDEQKQILKGIAESEFNLEHLPEYERDLAYEAIGKSGIEVQDACSVDMQVAGSLGAFLIRRKHQERTRFDPDRGVFEVPSEKKKENGSAGWKRVEGDYTEYPYPFGDARLLPKVIPINLSSVQVIDRNETHVTYDAKPSALMFMKMRPEDRILSADQLGVRFDVDRTSRRITRLTLYLPEGVRVYRGIKITSLEFAFEFDEDSTANRNVLRRVNHMMKGRIGGIFRPNFALTTDLTYENCGGAPNERSYLFAAIDSIRELK